MSQLAYEIIGEDLQGVIVDLNPQQTVRSEPGTMMFMENSVEMQTNLTGGIFGGLKRVFTGENLFITNFVNSGSQQAKVGFSAPYPGKIIPLNLAVVGGEFILQKDSFLCSEDTIEINITFTKRFGAGLFGGEGFILQKLTGNGTAFIHAGGTIVKRHLQSGEQLKVDTGCVVGFESSVDYDIKFVGGFKNTLFGGEGLFYALLKGPGTVYIQTLPLVRLADRLVSSRQTGNTTDSSGLGQFLGGLVSGD